MNNKQILAILGTIGIATSQAAPALAKNHPEEPYAPAYNSQALLTQAAQARFAQQASHAPAVSQARSAALFTPAANNPAFAAGSNRSGASLMSRFSNRQPVVTANQYVAPTTPVVNNPGISNWRRNRNLWNNGPVLTSPVVTSPYVTPNYGSVPVVYSPSNSYLPGYGYGVGGVVSTADIDAQKVSLAQGIQYATASRVIKKGPAIQLAMMINQLNVDESNAVARDGGAGVTPADHANLLAELQGISMSFSQMGGGLGVSVAPWL